MEKEVNVLIVSHSVKFFNSVKSLAEKYFSGEIFFSSCISDAKMTLLTKEISAIIINTPLSDGFGLEFAVNDGILKNRAVLIFTAEEFFRQTTEKVEQFGILTLKKPNTPEIISQYILLLKSAAKKLRDIKKEADDKKQTEEFKIILRAKMLLISSLGMSEEQAHKYIERRAMEARKTKKEIARNIIKSYGN